MYWAPVDSKLKDTNTQEQEKPQRSGAGRKARPFQGVSVRVGIETKHCQPWRQSVEGFKCRGARVIVLVSPYLSAKDKGDVPWEI